MLFSNHTEKPFNFTLAHPPESSLYASATVKARLIWHFARHNPDTSF